MNAKLADVVYNDGDLTRTVDIHTGDEFEEIANNLNALFEQTRAVVGDIKACSEEIHQVSENVDDTMHDAKGKITSISDYLQKMGAGIDFYRGYIKNSFANPYAGIKCQYRSGTCR